MAPLPAKGILPWRVDHHYRVNTRGDHRRNCRADDRFVYSPYYPLHDEQASKNVVLIMPLGWTASGGVGVRGRQRCKVK